MVCVFCICWLSCGSGILLPVSLETVGSNRSQIDTLLEFYQLMQVAKTQFFYTADPATLMQKMETLLESYVPTHCHRYNLSSVETPATLLQFMSRKCLLYLLWTLWIGMLSREEAETRETRVGLAGVRRCKLFNVQQVFYQQHWFYQGPGAGEDWTIQQQYYSSHELVLIIVNHVWK